MMAYEDTTAYLQSLASNALTQAQNNASRVYSLPPPVNLRDPNFDITLTQPNIGPPPDFGDLFGGDETDPTIQYMNVQADAWVAKYFPEISACLKSLPEEWLCGVISGVTPLGHSQTYFDLVWHRARDRAYRTGASQSKTLNAEFSSRGFTLPPGALVDALTQADQNTNSSILDVNREAALKDADIKLDLLKFAEEQAIRLKLGVMDALVRFYQQWIDVSDADIRKAQVRAQAQASLYSALSAYYNVELSFQQLRLRAAEIDAGIDIDVDRNALQSQQTFGAVASALGQAVSAFARTAGEAALAGSSLTAQIEST